MDNNNPLIASYQKADELFAELTGLLDDIKLLQKNPDSLVPLEQAELSNVMRERKRELKLNFDDLELQTDISISTLKRIIASPEKASLSNFLALTHELGMKVWLEK